MAERSILEWSFIFKMMLNSWEGGVFEEREEK